MSARLFLQKTPAEDREKNPNLPYFRLVQIPEVEGGDWIDIGAFWKAKSGNGYSGKVNDGVVVDTSGVNPWKPETQASGETVAVPNEAHVASAPEATPELNRTGDGETPAPVDSVPELD